MNSKQVKYNTYEEFLQGNPNYPIPHDIECLDLIIRKKWAEEILKGERNYDLRPFSFLLHDRICDQGTEKFKEDHKNDEEIYRWCNPVRTVLKIHYHDYASTWSLDVICMENGYTAPFDGDVEQLHQICNCHDLDDICRELNAENVEFRPIYYYFIIGDIISNENLMPNN